MLSVLFINPLIEFDLLNRNDNVSNMIVISHDEISIFKKKNRKDNQRIH